MSNNTEREQDGFLVWHPAVHARFRERLFFFLLALKPYKEAAFGEKLLVLLNEFGIPTTKGHEGYCSYAVLGDFDHLLRLWLPAQGEIEFIKRARTQIPNLKAILQFTVQSVLYDWRFPEDPPIGFVNQLPIQAILNVQSSVNKEDYQKVIDAKAAHWVGLPKGTNNQIKAFISLQPPANADDDQRDFIQKELIQLIRGSEGISQFTFHVGVGFTTLLAKLVADDFSKLASLLSRISKEYGGYGISTSTYAAIACLAQGDAVGLRGFAAEHAPSAAVQEFLPALSGASIAHDTKGKEIQRYVEDQILTHNYLDSDLKAFRELLNAVLQNDEGSAATALYLPTVQTERQIRELLKKVAVVSGKMEKLVEFLKRKNPDFKGYETVPLGSVLIAAREHVEQILPEWSAPSEFTDDNFNDLAKTRNRLMHGATLNLSEEWRSLADHLSALFRVRDELTSALNKCLQRLSPPATK